jgi:XTP/dITP diphosphohydrolase
LEEFRRLFAGTHINLVLDDFGGREVVEETGET